jgi:mono/diheme cytochrome c family protein
MESARTGRALLARRWVLALVVVCGQWWMPGMACAQGKHAMDADAAPSTEQLALGQRLYREGIRASGEPLTATGAAQSRLSGKDAACATCHRRSGFGSSEGKFVIRPIIGPALLQEQTASLPTPRMRSRVGVSPRPPYDEALLARAVRGGVDASGNPLNVLMPRYQLSDEEMKAMSAYLFTLSAKPSPGVDEQDINFAVVFQPGVTPARRRAMLDIMQAFFRDKGANARSDEQRREAGNMRMARSYRKWVLHVWDLQGPSAGWAAQLEALYRAQPVFALIGGLGSESWRPIHEFSERLEIPTVFPQTELPQLSGSNNYTFYFSRGVVLEAEVLAKFLRDEGGTGKTVQVYRREQAGAVAAVAFRAAHSAGAALEDVVLDGPVNEAFWRKVNLAGPSSLVLWLGAQDLAQAQVPNGGAQPAIYLSSELLEGHAPDGAARLGSDVRLVSPSDLPPRREARLLRNKLWLHNKGISIRDETVQFNTQFTMTVVSDVVGHIMDSFSRDYFVERIEHVVGQTPLASTYQSVSLGPGQRFAAKGGSIVQLLDGDKAGAKAISGWIVP